MSETQQPDPRRDLERAVRKSVAGACPRMRWVTRDTVKTSGIVSYDAVQALSRGEASQTVCDILMADTGLQIGTAPYERLQKHLKWNLKIVYKKYNI